MQKAGAALGLCQRRNMICRPGEVLGGIVGKQLLPGCLRCTANLAAGWATGAVFGIIQAGWRFRGDFKACDLDKSR
jgi:hypothetical protein